VCRSTADSSTAARDDRDGYASTLAGATRGLVLFGCLGAAGLAALASPLALALAHRTASPAHVAAGIAGLAPGVLGYALFALLSRALYARGDTRLAAAATAIGWAGVALTSVALSVALPRADRVAALALANSAGMLLLGGLLLVLVARRAGRAALDGMTRTLSVGIFAGLTAAAAGIATGVAVRRLTDGGATPGVAEALGQGMLSGVVVVAVFVGVGYALDRRDVRPVLARLVRRASRRATRRPARRTTRHTGGST